MTNCELIAILETLDPKAVAFIGGVEVDCAEIVGGRIREGHCGRTFTAMPDKPRDAALVFTHTVELSDGSIVQSPF